MAWIVTVRAVGSFREELLKVRSGETIHRRAGSSLIDIRRVKKDKGTDMGESPGHYVFTCVLLRDLLVLHQDQWSEKHILEEIAFEAWMEYLALTADQISHTTAISASLRVTERKTDVCDQLAASRMKAEKNEKGKSLCQVAVA